MNLDVCNCLMQKSAQGYEYLCVKFLKRTLLCLNRILDFVVNIRDRKNYEQKNIQQSYPEYSRGGQTSGT